MSNDPINLHTVIIVVGPITMVVVVYYLRKFSKKYIANGVILSAISKL